MAKPWWESWIPIALLAVLTLASVAPVRSYDLFWQLATGRWIVEHRALPLTDPFALASEQVRWINGEWLFQVGAYGIERAAGIAGFSWMRAIVTAAIFAIGFAFSRRRSEITVALAVCCVSWAGASPTLDARPSAFGALMTVLMIIAAEKRSMLGCAVVSAVWINLHPSAVIAPLIAIVLSRHAGVAFASTAALLLNPYGWRAVVAPVQLTALVNSGEFVNAEWLPSAPAIFPLLYVAMAVALAVIARADEPRAHVWRFLLLAFFALLAARHVRNQNLFFAAYPLLVLPAFPRLEQRWRMIAGAVAVAALLAAIATTPHASGLPAARFPEGTAAIITANDLRGNIYNPDQFGGYLMWSVYPERRVLTDGRNELHRSFISELGRSREDERAWRALLSKYRIDLAVEEMRPPLVVTDASTGAVRTLPASLAYWPRRHWALIGFDGGSMLFARRAAFPADVIGRLEMRGVVPDG